MVYRALIPPAVSGYALSPAKRGAFRFIKAESTENLNTNPSFEHPAGAFAIPTGYTATGAALITQSLDKQRRGYKAGQVILGAATEEGIYTTFGATSGQTYTFSADLLGAGGDSYRLYFANNAGTRVSGVTTVKSRGRWQRPHVSFMAQSTATYRYYLTRASGGSLRDFYTDGWQLENKPHPTTYCDGSLTGFIDGRTDFYWRGAPDASTSIRIAECRAGGREYRLEDFGFSVTGISGLGYEDVINYSTPLANGGSYYHGTVRGDGRLSIMGVIQSETPYAMSFNRAEIEQLIDFQQSTPDQPVLIKYSLEDCDFWDSECIQIIAVPESMPYSRDNDYQERVAINFSIKTPYAAQRCGDIGIELSYQTSVANANRALKRDADGVWSALGTGAASDAVRGFLRLPDGTYLVYGEFTSFGGVALTAGIARYNPQTGVVSSIGATLTGIAQDVLDAALAPNGDVYIAGAFSNGAGVGVNGIADTAYAFKWNYLSGVFSAISPAGQPPTGIVTSVYYANDGQLYIGFVGALVPTYTVGGSALTNVARRTAGGTWAAMTGMATSFTVNDIAASLDGTIYVSINVDGVYTANGLALTSITSGGAPPSATSLLFTSDGRMYFALSNSDSIGGVDVNYCGYYNGVTYFPLGTGFNNNALRTAYSAQDRLIYFSGTYTAADGVTLPDSMSGWNGSAHVSLDVDLPSTGNVYDIFAPSPDYLFVGYSTGGTATAAAVAIITNPGTANSYPIITIEGPGRLFQVKNYTTGVAVYFNITLLAGEIVTLDFASPRGATFTSSARGNISGYVLKGSNPDLFLKHGRNALSLFITGDTPGTTNAHLVYSPRFATLNGWALEKTRA